MNKAAKISFFVLSASLSVALALAVRAAAESGSLADAYRIIASKQLEPVSNPDGLRFTLPAIPNSDDDSTDSASASVSPFFITFNPSFSYHVKALSKPITGVNVEGRAPPRNENSGEPSRNTELLFGPGAEPKLLEMLRLVLFDRVTATLSTPLAVGQPLKAGNSMTFVNEAGTPSFVFTNRFPSK